MMAQLPINLTNHYSFIPLHNQWQQQQSLFDEPDTDYFSLPNGGFVKRYYKRVFVGGISSAATEAELRGVFSEFEPIKDVKIVQDNTSSTKAYAFVTFESRNMAEEVKRRDENGDHFYLNERKLNISQAMRKMKPDPEVTPLFTNQLFGHLPYQYQLVNGHLMANSAGNYTTVPALSASTSSVAASELLSGTQTASQQHLVGGAASESQLGLNANVANATNAVGEQQPAVPQQMLYFMPPTALSQTQLYQPMATVQQQQLLMQQQAQLVASNPTTALSCSQLLTTADFVPTMALHASVPMMLKMEPDQAVTAGEQAYALTANAGDDTESTPPESLTGSRAPTSSQIFSSSY